MDVTEWEYKEFPGAPHEKACLDGVDFWHAHSGDMLLDDLVRGIQEIAVRDLRASLTRVEEERDDLRQSVIAFAAPHAARYAKEFGFAPDELHPTHYDILEKCGARMDSFKRADLSRADGEKAING